MRRFEWQLVTRLFCQESPPLRWRPKDLEVALRVDTAERRRICVTDGDGSLEGREPQERSRRTGL